MEKIKNIVKENPKAFNAIGLILLASFGALVGVLTGTVEASDAVNSLMSVVRFVTIGL